MSRAATTPKRPTPSDGGRPPRRSGVLAALAVGVSAAAVALAVLGPGPEPTTAGPMGGTLSDVPMERSQTAAAGPVEVIGSRIDMGAVPLDVTVVPAWTITNTGSEPVDLGEPHASVVEGCCPGPLVLDVDRLEPGESASLSFPLQMHRGMDGPHRFVIHVPVGEGDDVLELQTIGDFRN